MNAKFKKMAVMSLAVAGSLLVAETASAEMITDVASRLTDQLAGISKLILGVMFVGGLVMGGSAFMKLREHNENPNQTKLSKPIVMFIVSAALIAIPTTLGIFTNTLGGEGHQSTDSQGSTYNQVK